MKLKRLLFFVPVVGFLGIHQLDAAGFLSKIFGGSKSSTPAKESQKTPVTPPGLGVGVSSHTRGQETSAIPKSGRERLSEIKAERQEMKKKKPTDAQQKALEAEALESLVGRARGTQSAREKYASEFKEIDAVRAREKALKKEKKAIEKEVRKEKKEAFKSKVFGKQTGEKKKKIETLDDMQGYNVQSKLDEIKNLPEKKQLAAAKKELKKLEKEKEKAREMLVDMADKRRKTDADLKGKNPTLYDDYANYVIDKRGVGYAKGRIDEIKKNDAIKEVDKQKQIEQLQKKLDEDQLKLKEKKKNLEKTYGKEELTSFKKTWKKMDTDRVAAEKMGEEIMMRPASMKTFIKQLEAKQENK